MIRVIAFPILGLACLAAPALACSTSGSSTFCSDGWLSQPVGPRQAPDDAADAGLAADPFPSEDQGSPGSHDEIYVEGAVTITDDGSDDGEL